MVTPKATIQTCLTSLLQVRHPIVSAPMCGMSMGQLAGSVAASGGVGLIGIGAAKVFGPERVRQEYDIALAKRGGDGDGAIGFGFLDCFMDTHDASFLACLDLEPDVIFLPFPRSQSQPHQHHWIRKVRDSKGSTKVFVQVFTVAEAVAAAVAGADAVVIQGCDAGGHGRQHLGAFIVSLVPQTKQALSEVGFSDCILLAAGGIACGAQLAAALTLGADGAVMGSAFVVAQESQAKDSFKQRIVESKDGTSGTTVSAVWDQLSKMGQPFLSGDFVGRALLDSQAVKHYHATNSKEITEEDMQWYSKGDYRTRAVWCSSSIGLLGGTPRAEDVVRNTMNEAIEVLSAPKHFSLESLSM